MNKNRIEGDAKQREQANNCKALVTKARRRRCGGYAKKVCDSYLGRSRPVGCSVAYAMTDASIDSSTRFLGLGLRGLASINASTPQRLRRPWRSDSDRTCHATSPSICMGVTHGPTQWPGSVSSLQFRRLGWPASGDGRKRPCGALRELYVVQSSVRSGRVLRLRMMHGCTCLGPSNA